jgi:hypothetical protein
MAASLFGTVRGIKGGYTNTILAHIINQISQGSVAGRVTGGRALRVGGVVKVGRQKVPKELTAIVSHVKDLTRNIVKEGKKPTNALGDMRLSCVNARRRKRRYL